jgi:hypothetical protein
MRYFVAVGFALLFVGGAPPTSVAAQKVTVPLAKLGGRVLEIGTKAPVRGAWVTLDSTDYVAISDANGRFLFEGVLPGRYNVRVIDSLVITASNPRGDRYATHDSLVQQVVSRMVTAPIEARLGRVSSVRLVVPWRAPVIGCGPPSPNERTRFVLFGTLQATDGISLANARVRLRWSDTTSVYALETLVSAVADAGGMFVVCGIPSGRNLAVRVVSTQGAELQGSVKVNFFAEDENGAPRKDKLRFNTIVVEPVVSPRTAWSAQSASTGRPPCAVHLLRVRPERGRCYGF